MYIVLTGGAGHVTKPLALQLLQGAMHEEVAKNYTEMGVSMRTGKMIEDYLQHKPETFGKVKLTGFVETFAAAYKKS